MCSKLVFILWYVENHDVLMKIIVMSKFIQLLRPTFMQSLLRNSLLFVIR